MNNNYVVTITYNFDSDKLCVGFESFDEAKSFMYNAFCECVETEINEETDIDIGYSCMDDDSAYVEFKNGDRIDYELFEVK